MKNIVFIVIILIFSMCTLKEQNKASIEHIKDFSSHYVPTRNIDIWLPDGYRESNSYNVLYMHDGQMLFDSTSTWNGQCWQVGEVMTKLIEAKKIEETIVVGIWNIPELRTIEYFPRKAYDLLPAKLVNSLSKERLIQAPTSDNYLKFITRELKPYIDSVYSTNTGIESTCIAGSSMGGLISMYAICEYPEVFGAAACMSTHWPGTFESNKEIPAAFKTYLEEYLPSHFNHRLYFDYGTETLDSLYRPYQTMIDSVMLTKGYTSENWITKEFVGHAHTETDWAKRLHIPLEFIMK